MIVWDSGIQVLELVHLIGIHNANRRYLWVYQKYTVFIIHNHPTV